MSRGVLRLYSIGMRLRARLASQDGVAMLVALGSMLVLGAIGTTAAYYSSTNTRSSRLSTADTAAFQLAEAGVHEAMSVLSNPANNPMTGTLLAQRTSTYSTGTVTWSGTLHTGDAKWTITSTGRVVNPSGPGSAAATRKITATAQVIPHYTEPQENGAWDYVFVTSTGQTCDMTMPSNFSWNANLYVRGNLCLSNNARITGGELVVLQTVDLNTTSSAIGSALGLVPKVQIGIGCQYANQHWHPDPSHPLHPFCSTNDNVWSTQLDQNPPVIPPPVPQWDTWYQNAVPGPKYPCSYSTGTPPVFDNDTSRNGSLNYEFDLTPVSAYSCRVGPANAPIGEITWDPTQNPKKLIVRGTIFIDGSAVVQGTGPYDYDGHGTIYLSGTYRVAGTKLCTRVVGSDCDYSGWNPNSEMITIVAGGNGLGGGRSVSLGSDTRFQGAIYSVNNMELAARAKHEGPLVVPRIELGADASTDPWNVVNTVPTGTPGETVQYSDVEAPKDYAG